MKNTELLEFAKRIQSLAQAGLTYSQNDFDLERYTELQNISIDMLAKITDEKIDKIRELFTNETGYQTPKTDIRSVIFKDNKILLVREKADNCWSLPGGWSDIGYTPSEVAVKEVKEEAGLDVKVEKLLAVFDKKCHPHPPSPYHVYKIFILCSIIGGEIAGGAETSEVEYFSQDNIPELSQERITNSQIDTLFEFLKNPDKVPLFD